MEAKEVRLAVVGSRTFTDQKLCWSILDYIKETLNYKYIEIVSGAARGADTFGERYADVNKIPKKIFPAEWDKYGKRAGYIRNVDIIKNCDICIAFWDGQSRGTQHDFKLCDEMEKTCYVYNFITKELYNYSTDETIKLF